MSHCQPALRPMHSLPPRPPPSLTAFNGIISKSPLVARPKVPCHKPPKKYFVDILEVAEREIESSYYGIFPPRQLDPGMDVLIAIFRLMPQDAWIGPTSGFTLAQCWKGLEWFFKCGRHSQDQRISNLHAVFMTSIMHSSVSIVLLLEFQRLKELTEDLDDAKSTLAMRRAFRVIVAEEAILMIPNLMFQFLIDAAFYSGVGLELSQWQQCTSLDDSIETISVMVQRTNEYSLDFINHDPHYSSNNIATSTHQPIEYHSSRSLPMGREVPLPREEARGLSLIMDWTNPNGSLIDSAIRRPMFYNTHQRQSFVLSIWTQMIDLRQLKNNGHINTQAAMCWLAGMMADVGDLSMLNTELGGEMWTELHQNCTRLWEDCSLQLIELFFNFLSSVDSSYEEWLPGVLSRLINPYHATSSNTSICDAINNPSLWYDRLLNSPRNILRYPVWLLNYVCLYEDHEFLLGRRHQRPLIDKITTERMTSGQSLDLAPQQDDGIFILNFASSLSPMDRPDLAISRDIIQQNILPLLGLNPKVSAVNYTDRLAGFQGRLIDCIDHNEQQQYVDVRGLYKVKRKCYINNI